MLDVWFNYMRYPEKKQDLLITPHWDYKPGEVSNALIERFKEERKTYQWKYRHRKERYSARIAHNQSSVVGSFSFDELIRVVLPMSEWWKNSISVSFDSDLTFLKDLLEQFKWKDFQEILANPTMLEKTVSPRKVNHKIAPGLIWLVKLVGTMVINKDLEKKQINFAPEKQIHAVEELMKGMIEVKEGPLLFTINRNRDAFPAILRSVKTIKADASWNLFKASCKGITWAIIDSGIDAGHPAFRAKNKNGDYYPKAFGHEGKLWRNYTRISEVYDFTIFRDLICDDNSTLEKLPQELQEIKLKDKKFARDIRIALKSGRELDWELLVPYIKVPIEKMDKISPINKHGTHVAGILGADWPMNEKNNPKNEYIHGVCPDINILDLRVFDDAGAGNEFNVMAALQFVRYLNAHKDYTVVHGVNLSLSIMHDVRNYACGRTPVCEECNRVIGSGVVIVAAAGNLGFVEDMRYSAFGSEYKSINITDPGNTESVITVGSTHRSEPHTYGVSFFTSRGPTGDGRVKPDLVAPGEKIDSTIPNNGLDKMDGTSMAAPHVSGAAALLIARNMELAGQPIRVKEILCKTATDLGREKYFQGCGLVDILRALQSI
jgi:hypothetical protein